MAGAQGGAAPGAPTFGKRPIDKYDGEIAFVDQQVGVILKALRDAGRADDTVVVITADHGEEFGEHGGEFHGRTVYNEVMHVPLLVHDPGAPAQVVTTPVSVVDIAPTVLGLAGLPAPAGMNGRSLAATVVSGAPAPTDRVVLGELLPDYRITGDQVTGFVDGWHLVWDRTADTLQLFSLERDPLDQAPIEHGPVFDDLRAPAGVFAVTGNHEYYSGADAWIAHLRSLGITVLRNERVELRRGDATIDLVGIDDHGAHHFGGDHGADLARALAGRAPDRVAVLLAHQPRQVHVAAQHDVDVQLSGHTHGGQVWPWHYLVSVQQGGLLAGRYRVGPTELYVSRGAGHWGPPIRLGAPRAGYDGACSPAW